MALSQSRIWILAARPKTLTAAAAPVIIGSAMAWEVGALHVASAIAALIGALLIQIGTNFANDYFDYCKGTDEGERLGPMRVTQAGLVSPGSMKRATIIVFGLAVLIGIFLVYRGGWPIVIIGLLSILFGVLYTGGPYPLGYNGLGDIFVLIFFGPVAVGGTYYVQALGITGPVMLAGLAPGLFSVAILTVNNLRDLETDRRSGKKTLAVRLGKTFSVAEYIGCILLACAVPVTLYLWHDSHPWVMLSSCIALVAIPSFKSVCTDSGKVLNDTLAATGRLLFMFSILFSIGWLL